MDPRTILTRGVSTGLRLGRGTADRVATLAGPPLGRLTGRVVSKVRRPDPGATTTTFVPSRKPTEQDPAPQAQEGPDTPAAPSPASVAQNIAPQRPTAKPARSTRPTSAPGAKLPPPRPSTS